MPTSTLAEFLQEISRLGHVGRLLEAAINQYQVQSVTAKCNLPTLPRLGGDMKHKPHQPRLMVDVPCRHRSAVSTVLGNLDVMEMKGPDRWEYQGGILPHYRSQVESGKRAMHLIPVVHEDAKTLLARLADASA